MTEERWIPQKVTSPGVGGTGFGNKIFVRRNMDGGVTLKIERHVPSGRAGSEIIELDADEARWLYWVLTEMLEPT